mgnify:CR=1 FL=1
MNMTIWWLALALMLLCEGALIGIAPRCLAAHHAPTAG